MTGPSISADLKNKKVSQHTCISLPVLDINIEASLDWRPGVSVSVVMGRPPPHGAPVLHYGQPPLDVIEKIGNGIQIVAAGGKSSEDCKVNKNDC